MKANTATLVKAIDTWLPQTQCTRCGYPRCWLYAEAIASDRADINQCSPGGEVTLGGLADLLGVPTKPLNPQFGAPQPRMRAVIDESHCIGCRKCLDTCPVDAIVGAAKLMHTVIAEDCTGCELCITPCPVDCITMVPVTPACRQERWPDYSLEESNRWRGRTEARLRRLERENNHSLAGPKETASMAPQADETKTLEQMREEIRAAVVRVKAKRTH